MSKYKQYLGDSVYADYQGSYIVLTTECGQPDDAGDMMICLEPKVFDALNTYANVDLPCMLEKDGKL